jgi:hypothetical protein
MLRLLFLGLLMLLGVGVLSAMELRTPPRRAAVIVQSPAEPSARISAAHDALAKTDRLEVAAVRSGGSTQTTSVEERIAPPENVSIASSEPPKAIARQRHNPDKISAAARPKPKPKASGIKRAAISQPSRAVSHTEPCRLAAFGGLRKALNIAACEI